jgi:hypothetical protein
MSVCKDTLFKRIKQLGWGEKRWLWEQIGELIGATTPLSEKASRLLRDYMWATADASGLFKYINWLTKVEKRRLGSLLGGEGPNFLPGWRVVNSRTGEETSADGLCGDQAYLWGCVIVPQREYDIIRRVYESDLRRITNKLKGSNPDQYTTEYNKLRVRLRQLKHRTNVTLAKLYPRNPKMRIESWRGPRGRGLHRKGDTGEPPA